MGETVETVARLLTRGLVEGGAAPEAASRADDDAPVRLAGGLDAADPAPPACPDWQLTGRLGGTATPPC